MKLYELYDVFADSCCNIELYYFEHRVESEEYKLSRNEDFTNVYNGDISNIPIIYASCEVLRSYIEDEHTLSALVK